MSHAAEQRESAPKILKDSAFQWEDPLGIEHDLSEEERMVRDTARGFAHDTLMPRVVEAYRDEKYDASVLPAMGKLGLIGSTIPEEYGGAGLGYVAYGLIARELERVDSGYRSTMSVQSSLVMYPIYAYGTEAQRRKYLPKLATGELIGCFGLTEPDHGSDPGGMVTRAEKVAGGYRLNGAKTWISNAPVAHLAVVWAKLDNVIRGFIVERGSKGFRRPRSKASSACAPRSPASSCWKTSSSRRTICCRTSRVSPARSAVSTMRATAFPGAPWAPPSSAGTVRGNTRSSASSSAARLPPISWCKRSSPTCRPRLRWACPARCAWGACWKPAAPRRPRSR